MAMNFLELDQKTRSFMIEELDWSIENKKIYYSALFIEGVENQYISLLREAITEHNENWLEQNLTQDFFKDTQLRKTKKGTTSTTVNKRDAARRLAQNEFNKFYIRGICKKALNDGKNQVEIYRARDSSNKRAESEAQIGTFVNANELLENLRNEINIKLPEIYSGLSVKT